MENENGVDHNRILMNQTNQNYLQQFNYMPPQNIADLQNNQLYPDTSLQNNSTHQIPLQENQEQAMNNDILNDKSEEDSEEKKNTKGLKRRSKSEVEGRTHQCKLCNKSYLSYPALYTHYKLKHNTNNSSGKGRGRPKKEQNESEVEKSRYNPTNVTFFSKEERTGKIETSKINECIDIAFAELYSEKKRRTNESREMKNYLKVEEHPFLNKFKTDIHDTNKNVINEKEKADIVLIDYLNKMSLFCNKEYYIRLIKFVTLFREHVNIYNSKINKAEFGDVEYTAVKEAEDVPDCSNEFITDFLLPDENENDFGFTKEEAIDLTQNICYWMYENNFTCSKLSLINNEK